MALRRGIYVVPTDRWYIERTVWLIAGIVLLTSTLLAVAVDPLWIFGVIATGLASINVALTGFCPIGNLLLLLGLKPMLGAHAPGTFISCKPTAGTLRDASTPRSVSTSFWDRHCSWCIARGGPCSPASSALQWFGLLRRGSASWRTYCTGSALNHD
jgi:hypothetical protein